MSFEYYIALYVGALGVFQYLIPGEQGKVIRRNFNETLPMFAGLLLFVTLLQWSGEYSERGMLLYAAGRTGYIGFSYRPIRLYRKYVWALSIAGLFGMMLQLVLRLL